ncbi:MAG: tetratricopeptide repeat protein [Fibrobacteres bacterium]|nr:tetratricopeptide repeat protein [Fibrobacterota bacterium]
MKKILLIAPIPILAIGALLVWQNLPQKRFAKHVTKARLYAKEGNLTAARIEYEKGYSAQGAYTPYVSLEVLNLANRLSIQDGKPREALENTQKFVAAHKTNKEGRVLLAGLAFEMGETELGFDALNELLVQDPWNYRGRLLLTQVRAKQGRLDLAEQQLRYLYSKYPDSVQALLPMAEVLLRERRSSEGREFLRRALVKEPKNVRARLLLVDSYLMEKQLDSAELMLDQWQESDPDKKQQVQIRKARLYSLAGRLGDAEAALAPYLKPTEDNLQALSELAILHAKGGRYDSALALYRAIGDVSPKASATAEIMSYYLDMKAQNPARALEALKTLQISDKRPALLPPLIAAYLAIGQDNKAQDLIAQQPDSLKRSLTAFMGSLLPDKEFIGQWALITYFSANHQNPSVFQAVEDLYKRWPKQRLAIEMWTSQLSAMGRYADAAKVLATLDKPELGQRVGYLQLLASAGQGDKARDAALKLSADYPDLKGVNLILAEYWVKKDKAKAMDYYQKELALNPDNLVALNNLAWEYGVVQGDLAKARPFLDKLKGVKNLDPRILDTVGWILAVNGQAAEGEPYLRNAIDLVPDFPAFQYHLAFILARTGKKDEARDLLKQALSATAAFEERKDAEKLMSELG